MSNTERAAFEAFCCKRWGGDRDALTINSDDTAREFGEYLNGHVQFAWAAWQARAAIAQQPDLDALAAQIMNLQAPYRHPNADTPDQAFRQGHKVARHAAAELVGAAIAQQPAKRDDGMPASEDERKLRRMYCARVGIPGTYMDDGEAHGTEHGIQIDFMREPVSDIAAKVMALEVARYECRQGAAIAQPAEPMYAKLAYRKDMDDGYAALGAILAAQADAQPVAYLAEDAIGAKHLRWNDPGKDSPYKITPLYAPPA